MWQFAVAALPFASRITPWLTRAGSAIRGALFGTPARSGLTGFFAGTKLADVIPDPIKNLVPGGAATLIVGGIATVLAAVIVWGDE